MENTLDQRITKGSKFFRTYIVKENKFDSTILKKYLPTFLTFIDEFMTEMKKLGVLKAYRKYKETGDEDIIKEALKVFPGAKLIKK